MHTRVCVRERERDRDRPVSYTHLDVYKRQASKNTAISSTKPNKFSALIILNVESIKTKFKT